MKWRLPHLGRETRGHIVLMGARGSGKSTVGRMLAEGLGCPFHDSDREIEQREGRSIHRIFEETGEPGFRQRESAILAELIDRPTCVIATGGGAVEDEGNRRVLPEAGWIVWLDASAQRLWERVTKDPDSSQTRPPLTEYPDQVELVNILERRRRYYRALADLRVDTENLDPQAVLRVLIEHVITP